MGQIVKRKKKGRPSKADLARRAATSGLPASSPERDIRRSLRRRNVRYTFDFDDFIDEDDDEDEDEGDDEEEDENERRREKELKQLLKSKGTESEPSRTQRVDHAPSSSDEEEEEDGRNRLKKRRINGEFQLDRDEGEEDVRGNDDANQLENEIDDEYDEEAKERKSASNGACSVPGKQLGPGLGIPLPDKKTLELILDRLQKKDRFSVYAVPVDPEELPDYFDVIEHPMDFSTVRKKLANGSYLTLEQFESDVFLISSNAMQYNAPDTVYYRQARSIQELAKKKFETLRADLAPSEKELKTEDKIASDTLDKKQTEKQLSRNTPGALGSDTYSGHNPANAGDFQNSPNPPQAGGCTRPSYADGLAERNNSPIDNIFDKGDDFSGRSFLSKQGRKPMINDEERRATYNISTEPVTKSESMLSIFDSEVKMLVGVGINSDHSYARSLARFAATLGPVAWKAAAKKIEQALPPGYKFGRGWVGDYEPLPTPTLQLENCFPKEPPFAACAPDGKGDGKLLKRSVSGPVHTSSSEGKPSLFGGAVPKTPGSSNVSTPVPGNLEGKSSLFGGAVPKTPGSSNVSTPVPGNLEGKSSLFGGGSVPKTPASSNTSTPVPGNLEVKQPFFYPCGNKLATASVNCQQQRNFEPERKAVKQVESANCNPVVDRQVSNGTDMQASKSRNPNYQSVPFKLVENGSHVSGPPPSRNVANNGWERDRIVTSKSSDFTPNQMMAATGGYSQDQCLSDPVQLMRMMAENAQRQKQQQQQQAISRSPSAAAPPSRKDSGNASAVAAQTWMSIGAGGSKPDNNTSSHKNHQMYYTDRFNNPQGELQMQMSRLGGDSSPVSGTQFQASSNKNGFPLQALMPVQMGHQFQNRPMVVSHQVVTADLSRFQVQQSPWQAVNPQNQAAAAARQRQQSLPPDLNIGFQSSGSPASQSSGVLVDSQQPDLALQL